MKTPEKLHIGELIRKQLDKNGQTIVWLANETGCNRSRLHRIFKNPHVYSDDLWKISSILKHDFFLDISNYLSDFKEGTEKV